jgi:hypothetical protein
MADTTTNQPFAKALAGVVSRDDRYVTRLGAITWSEFAKALPSIHYETLRKMLHGERQLDERAIEEIAAAAGVDPCYFAEYRLMKARDRFDPRVVGLDEALSNLERHLSRPGRDRQARRRA